MPSEASRISSKFSTPKAHSILGKIVTCSPPFRTQRLANFLDCLTVADKGGGDVVDALLETKKDVCAVALGDGGQADVHVGHVDALALTDLAAVLDDAVDVVALDELDFKADQAVVDQNRGSLGDFFGEVEVIERDVLGGAEVVLGGRGGGYDDGVALSDSDLLVVFEQTGANFGALGVEQDADGLAELCGKTAHALDALVMLLVGTVREVKAGDVHAGLDHFAQRILVVASRAHGADDFCTFEHAYLHRSLCRCFHFENSIRQDVAFDYERIRNLQTLLPAEIINETKEISFVMTNVR